MNVLIIHIVEHLLLAIAGEPGQRQRTGAAGQNETRVQFVGGGQSLVWPSAKITLNWPAPMLALVGNGHCRRLVVIVGQIKSVQGNVVGAGIVKFQPGSALAGAVGDAGQIVGLQFIDPQRREGRQRFAPRCSARPAWPGRAPPAADSDSPWRRCRNRTGAG